MPPLPTGPPDPVPTHVALKDELFTATDLEKEALSLLDLCLLHRLDLLHGQQALRGLALAPPLEPVGEQVEVPPLPLGQEGVAHLGHVAVHDAVLAQGVVCVRERERPRPAVSPASAALGSLKPEPVSHL